MDSPCPPQRPKRPRPTESPPPRDFTPCLASSSSPHGLFALGEALKFAVSPTVITSTEALNVASRHPERVKLMPIENRHLSIEEAEARQKMGEDLLISPHSLRTNEYLFNLNKFYKDFGEDDVQDLKKLVQPSEVLYREFLGVSWRFCETDLVSMVVYTLDYYVKSEFLSQYAYYERLLVPFVFQSSKGNAIRYFDVLKEHERLVSTRRALSAHEEKVLEACNNLLKTSERKLVNEFGERFSSRYIRTEMLNFIDSNARSLRMFGTHVFSSMVWEDFVKPLNAQNLHDYMPRPKREAFKFTDLGILREMLIRALVIEDMSKKLSKNVLDSSCRHIHLCGFKLVKKFMSKHVPYSFKVTYKSLSAIVLKEKETISDITLAHQFDLGTFSSLM